MFRLSVKNSEHSKTLYTNSAVQMESAPHRLSTGHVVLVVRLHLEKAVRKRRLGWKSWCWKIKSSERLVGMGLNVWLVGWLGAEFFSDLLFGPHLNSGLVGLVGKTVFFVEKPLFFWWKQKRRT